MRPSVITAAESTGCRPLARSTVRTVSIPSRRTPSGGARGGTGRAAAPCRLRAGALIRRTGSQRATFERDDGLVLAPAAAIASASRPSAGRRATPPGSGSRDDPHDRADEARGDVEPSSSSVRTSRSLPSTRPPRLATVFAGGAGAIRAAIPEQRLDPVAAVREQEQAVAVRYSSYPIRLSSASESSRRGRAPVTSTARSFPPHEGEQRLAVRLDEVGLVDPSSCTFVPE